MEQNNFRALLRRTVTVPVVALAILAAILVGEIQSLKTSMKWVDHTNQVISSGTELIKLAIDMETGVRGYLNTGGHEFLLPYDQAGRTIDSKFSDLNQLVSDNPAQQGQLARVRSRFEEWRSLSARAVEQRRLGEIADEGLLDRKRMMDSVRAEHDRFMSVEEHLRNERVRSARATSTLVISTSLLFTLAIGVLLAVFTRRQMRTLATQFQHSIETAEQQAAALRESEERFRVAQELSPDGFLIFRPLRDNTGAVTDFLWIYENDAAARMNDTDPKEVCGKRVSEVLPHHDQSPFHRAYKEVAETGEVRVVEEGVYGHDTFREPRWFRVAAVPTAGGDVAVLVQNVTERKRAEQALEAERELLGTVVNHLPAAVLLADGPELRLRIVNPAYQMLAPGKEMAGKTLEEVWPEIGPNVPALFRHVLQTGKPHHSIDERFLIRRSQDGPLEEAYFSWSVFRVRVPGNGHWGLLNTAFETTERKKIEDALRASEERWATTLKSIGDAVISTDAAGNVEFMNDIAQKLTGWSLTEARGRELGVVFNIVQEVTRLRPESPVAKVIRLGKIVGLANHTVLIKRDGTEIPIEDSAAPILDKKGEIEGVVLVFHDVSDQRRAERVLRTNERLATTGRLAATIAHEIHNPLDAVGNLLYLLEEGTKDETQRGYLKLASSELGRVTQMTQQMLTFQREAAKPVPVQMGEILDTVVLLYGRKVQAAGITIEKEVDDHVPIMGFPGELRQIVANLFGNAIEALRSGEGKIALRTRRSRDRRNGRSGLRVVIADNGPGIPAAIRSQIFEPFFTTKGESGTGLGLWITADIVRKYDGTIRVWSSTRPGGSGTCFSVFFPFAAKTESQQG